MDSKCISKCGLNCNDCPAFNGKIPDLADELRHELKKSRYGMFANFISSSSIGKGFKEYDACYRVLGEIAKWRCEKPCQEGGGLRYCVIRECSNRKEINGCWECDEFEDCEKMVRIKAVHGNAAILNIRKIRQDGIKALINDGTNWYIKP